MVKKQLVLASYLLIEVLILIEVSSVLAKRSPICLSFYNQITRFKMTQEAIVVKFRCLRCTSLMELMSTDDLALCGVWKIGYNLYYCSICARATGWFDRE